jgi:hypothetical protein
MAVSVAGRAAEAARPGFVTFDSGRGKERADTVAGRMVISVRFLAGQNMDTLCALSRGEQP